MITISTKIQAPLEKVWRQWTDPEHIEKWNHANDDWHTTKAENDLRVGGRFNSRMEAKDASMGFDFGGTYTEVKALKLIVFKLDDGREVEVNFSETGHYTQVIEKFEPEDSNSTERQKSGWKAILDSFKKYVENSPN